MSQAPYIATLASEIGRPPGAPTRIDREASERDPPDDGRPEQPLGEVARCY